MGGARAFAPFDYVALRKAFACAYIANNGCTRDLAIEALAEGRADLIAFAKLFISNPDLGERFRLKSPPNPFDTPNFYGSKPVSKEKFFP